MRKTCVREAAWQLVDNYRTLYIYSGDALLQKEDMVTPNELIVAYMRLIFRENVAFDV